VTPASDDAARRQAIRRIARQHHPDVGGDAETFVSAVAALTMCESGAAPTPTLRAPPVAKRVARRLRRRLRAWLGGRRDRRRRRAGERLSARRRGDR
jgi:curved DNA-binding protein CbpA